MTSPVRFQLLTEADLPILVEWFARPHVHEVWKEKPSLDEAREKYLPRMEDESDVRPDLVVRAFVQFLFKDPDIWRIQIDPAPDNGRAVRCYEKVGFREVARITTVDGPAVLMHLDRERWEDGRRI